MRRPLILFLVGAGIASMGTMAPADAFKPSVKDQIKLGQQAAADLRKHEKILPASDVRVQTLRRVARRILDTFPANEPWQYSFDVIDSKDVNAFALPGGPTFFYTGLVDKLKTEDEMAGIIGHELTHVRHEDWARMYADSQKRQLGLTALLLVLRVNNTGSNLAGLANGLYSLKYSRGVESNADHGGFAASEAAGYNPQGLADAFTLLDKLAGSDKSPEFLSDHPSDNKRIGAIEKMVKDSKRSFPPQRPLAWAK